MTCEAIRISRCPGELRSALKNSQDINEGGALTILIRGIGLGVCSFLFGGLNYVLSCLVDFAIARQLGAVRPITSGLFSGGEEYGGIEWTLTSFWGLFFSLPRGSAFAVGFLLGALVVGYAAFELIRSIFFAHQVIARKVAFWIGVNLALWVLRFPVPIEYSLFYWTAIRF